MQYVTKLYVTEIDKDFEGDAVFPRINEEVWKEVSRDEGLKDEDNDLTYDFITYIKNNQIKSKIYKKFVKNIDKTENYV